MADPDALARLVHETRVAHEADRAAEEGRVLFNLGTWEDRAEHQRELDRRIASAVAMRAVADAKLVNERRDALLFALGVAAPAILEALTAQISDQWLESQKIRFRNAETIVRTLRGSEEDR